MNSPADADPTTTGDNLVTTPRCALVAARRGGDAAAVPLVAEALLAQLDTEHPSLAGLPARERLLAAAWLAAYRSARTRRAYAGDLAAWLDWLHGLDVDVLAARRVHVDLWVRQLLDPGAASSSTARRLSALTSFYRHLVEHDLLAANPAAAVRRPSVDPDHTATVGLDRDQARAFLAAADTDTGPARLRTAAAARLLLHLGLRVDELAAADITDLGHDRGHRVLTVTRKGGRRATVVLPPATAAALDAYLTDRARRRPADPARRAAAGHRDRRPARPERAVEARAPPRPRRRHPLRRRSCPRTRCATPRSPWPSTPAPRCATCRTSPATATPAPPAATTAPATPSTATPPTPSPPTSPALDPS